MTKQAEKSLKFRVWDKVPGKIPIFMELAFMNSLII